MRVVEISNSFQIAVGMMWSNCTYSLFILLNNTTVSRLVIRGLNSVKDFLRKICTNYLAEGIIYIYNAYF